MKKENKGITLIALVITIIVLLILAGVAIATLTGENGILTKANEAKIKTTEAGAYEQVQVQVLGSMGTNGKVNIDELNDNLRNNISGLIYKGKAITEKNAENENRIESLPVTVTVDGTKVTININGKVELAFDTEEWDKTATPEDVFIWKSDDLNNEDYGVVVGYTENVQNYTILRYPSRCTSISIDDSNMKGSTEENMKTRGFVQNIVKVEHPSTIIKIENCGKYFFRGVKETNIPSSITSIGDQAFYGWSSLINITIPNSVTSIENQAFSNCTNLTNITIPDSVTSIGIGAFEGCTGLTNITIPDGVTSIENQAFSNCTNLTNITIPDSVTSISREAFANCKSLTNINISDSITSISMDAFRGCINLQNIIIWKSIEKMGYRVFGNWQNTQTINIQASENDIPDGWDKDWNKECNANIVYAYKGQ